MLEFNTKINYKPNMLEEYYYINIAVDFIDNIKNVYCKVWCNDLQDLKNAQIGNVFQLEKEAKAHCDIVINTLKRHAVTKDSLFYAEQN